LLQVSLQLGKFNVCWLTRHTVLTSTAYIAGSVVGLSVQAGLYSRVNNDLSNWKGTQYGFYFVIAWLAVSLIVFTIFYRPEKSQKVLQELETSEKMPATQATESSVSPV
jgi:hypothetical protein